MFSKSRSRRGSANCVAPRRSVVLLAQEKGKDSRNLFLECDGALFSAPFSENAGNKFREGLGGVISKQIRPQARMFSKSRSRKGSANWVAPRRSVVLLAQEKGKDSRNLFLERDGALFSASFSENAGNKFREGLVVTSQSKFAHGHRGSQSQEAEGVRQIGSRRAEAWFCSRKEKLRKIHEICYQNATARP